MVIYHGSSNVIKRPEYGKGKLNNDYGQGFYCTEDQDLAREWAVDENRDGYMNIYNLNLEGINILNLNGEDYCALHWITILIQNRRFSLDTPLANEAYRYLTDNYSIDLSHADVIQGYRADDSYFSYAQDFINGDISVTQLMSAMRLGNLGEQIMIRSKKAFNQIEYKGCEGVSAFEWYEKKRQRDICARKSYWNMNREGYIKGDLYMVRIIDEEVKSDDPRLR